MTVYWDSKSKKVKLTAYGNPQVLILQNKASSISPKPCKNIGKAIDHTHAPDELPASR
jgi:hypothetical protein